MEPTRIPASLNEESVFISISELKLSMRQLMLILFGGVLWFGIATFISNLFHINQFFALLAFSWILLGSFAFAFIRVDGKKLDEYLGEKLAYEFGPKTYVLKEEDPIEDQLIIEDRTTPNTLYDSAYEPVTSAYGGRTSDDVEVTKE